MLIYIQNKLGEIVAEATFDSIDEMLECIRVMSKPSMFGTKDFRIVIQRKECVL